MRSPAPQEPRSIAAQPDPESRERRVLSTWKQIASYLDVSIPTAKKYKNESGLPVYQRGKRYYAYSDAIDRWNRESEARQRDSVQGQGSPEKLSKKPGTDVAEGPRRRDLRCWLPVIGGAVILAAIVAVLWIEPANPAQAILEESTLRILDADGRELWSVPVSDPDPEHSQTLVQDVDGDGLNEILFSLWPIQSKSKPGWLKCFDHRGGVLWEFVYGREMTVRGRYFEPLYDGSHLLWVTGLGEPYIVAISRHAFWYPSQVVLLDPSSGEIAAEYWHPGYIYNAVLFDVGRDGKKELLLGGANNPNAGFGHASLAILPLPFNEPPAKRHANFFGDWNQRERSYILFPTPDYIEVAEKGPAVYSLNVQQSNRLSVGIGYSFNTLMLYYYLDADLRVVDMREGDRLVSGHNQLYRRGLLDHRFSEYDRGRLRKIAFFPTAPDGNSAEVRNLLRKLAD